MNNNLKKESLKKKIITSLICGLVYILLTIPINFIYPIPGISEYEPISGINPVFGILFGPWGAIGITIASLITHYLMGYAVDVCLILSLFQFLYAYIPYKLWYSFNFTGEITTPRLNTVKNLIKLILIAIINSTLMTFLHGFYMDVINYVDFPSFITLLWELNSLDFTLIFATIIITLASIFKWKLYIPEKNKKPIFPPNFYNIILIIALSLGITYIIYSYLFEPLYNGLIFGTIYGILLIILVFKPVTETIKIRNYNGKTTITEKLILFFIAIGTIIAILAGVILVIENTSYNVEIFGFSTVLFVNLAIILFIFYLVAIYVLSKIEKEITLPIESISSVTNEYINSKNKMEDSREIINKIKKDKPNNTEIGILGDSFIKMISGLKVYMQELEKETKDKERLKTELKVSKTIQNSIISKEFPKSKEFDIYAINKSADEIGGDFYDFFFIDNNHFAFIIADVSGKGIPAALFMLNTKTLIKNYAYFRKSASDTFYQVNNSLYENNDESMFVTAWMGILELDTGQLVYVNAGHNSPLIKKEDHFEWLKSKNDLVLGAKENQEYEEHKIQLNKNDELFLYTDGVIDANNTKGEFFTSNRLIKLLNENSSLSIEPLIIKIKDEVNKFSKGESQFDDITLLGLKYKK
ncbi:SpoIIE family protein phosphatase [Methanobrevibacter sp. DSM 116169]|uniref:SpoIIE family protein phosphatase n=1 Tax=Methanobrevibacter sp. DSM 116169 TaxID=3242727 RepID=UPI0038FCC083